MKKKITKTIPWILLGFSFILLIFLNLFFQDHWLDSDMAAEMMFSKLLAEEGHAIATPDWYYSTEFRVLYTQLIMGPLFRICNNWHLIRTVTNLLFYGIMLASYFYFVKPLKISGSLAAVTSLFLLLPFSETMMTHMQMGNTYLSHVILCFLFFGMFLRLVGKEDPKKFRRSVTAVCYILLALICGVSGVRYLLALQCPLVLTAFFYLVKSREFQDFRQSVTWEKCKGLLSGSSFEYMKYGLLGLVAGVAGYGINVLWISKKYVFQTYGSTNFIAIYQGVLFERLQNAIGTLLMLFGYVPERGFLSLRGLISMISFVFLGTFAFCIWKCLKSSSGVRRFMTLFVTTAFFLNVFVFVFTTSTMVPRYYITILIFALPVLAFYWESGTFPLDRMAVGLILALCLLVSTGKIVLSFATSDKNADKREVAAFLEDNGYDFGFATYVNGNIITELTEGAVEIANVGDPQFLDYFLWSTPAKYYQEGYHQGETFLLLTAEEALVYGEARPVQEGTQVYRDAYYTVLLYDSVEELMSYAEERY